MMPPVAAAASTAHEGSEHNNVGNNLVANGLAVADVGFCNSLVFGGEEEGSGQQKQQKQQQQQQEQHVSGGSVQKQLSLSEHVPSEGIARNGEDRGRGKEPRGQGGQERVSFVDQARTSSSEVRAFGGVWVRSSEGRSSWHARILAGALWITSCAVVAARGGWGSVYGV